MDESGPVRLDRPGVSPRGNPVLPVGAADPHAALFGDRYYIYATGAGKTEPGFAAWSSPDLRSWRYEGMCLRLADVAWARGRDWAPAIAERNGRYYFYFSADDRIGVAVGESPVGPFHDALGEPLAPYKDDISVIDPMAFVDADGRAYLYYGAVPATWLEGKVSAINRALSVRRLNDDMVSFADPELPTIEVGTGGAHIEGSFVVERRGVYYLMWSEGNWNASDEANAYRVCYATSASPTGPWEGAANNPILSTDWSAEVIAPGHHSVLRRPGADEYYIVYHKHKADGDRRVCIDRMAFTPEGEIARVTPTREGPPADPVRLSVSASPAGPLRAGGRTVLTAHCALPDAPAVEFFDGNTRIGAVSHAPYAMTWEAVPPGFHRITARAASGSGESAASAPFDMDAL